MDRRRTNPLPTLIATAALGCLLAIAPRAYGQSLTDYTAYPTFVSSSVPPNILFIIDLSEAMLQAAYGTYPESSGGKVSSNLTGDLSFAGLCGTNAAPSDNGNGCPTPSGVADTFDPNTTYSGIFNPLACYTYASGEFGSRTAKTGTTEPPVARTCTNSEWDGNFLNWLAMRKIDQAKKVLIGGRTLSASNNDGTANKLLGEPKIGTDGTSASCVDVTPSQRYFCYVKEATGSGRFPSSLPKDSSTPPKTYFGLAGGSNSGVITVSNVSTATTIFAGTAYNIQVDLTNETDAYRQEHSLGLLQNLRTDNMRVAVMFTNSSNGKAATLFREFDGNFNASAITGIRNQALSSYAALAEGTYEAFCLYRNSQGPCYNNSPADFSASVGSAGDPYYFASTASMTPCCRSYILMISSGQPTQDGGAPDRQSPFGNLFASDTVGLNTTFLDDVAYYGQTNDIRNQAVNTSGYLQGTQKVTFYSVNAMGGPTGAQVLASAAKYGGFEDRDSNNLPNATGQSCTYPAGSALGTGTANSSAEWDKNQDCIPDTFFDAVQGSDLESAIKNAIADILKRSASGTSVSVLATSSTGEGTIYQAYFFPSQFEGLEEVKWSGYTQGLFVDAFGNLREDTDGDGKLIYEHDHIVKTRYDSMKAEVKADRYEDGDGDGVGDTTTPFESVGLKDLKPIWEAGRRLALRDLSSSPRNLLTWVDTDNDALVDSGEVIAFNSTNASTLSPYLRADTSGGALYSAANIVSFIQGNHVSGMRDRRLTIKDDTGGDVLKVWRYGDPVNSTPTVVGAPKERFDIVYGDATYSEFFLKWKNRRLVAYVGANDGMLHAFNGGFYHRGDDPSSSDVEHGYFTTAANGNSGSIVLGQELWGFIPYELLPHLKWLTQPDYTHVYYVDLKPKVTDVRIFTPDTDHPNGWGTILIGGFRMGGSCQACTNSGGGPPMTVTANFGSGNQTRTFYSAYFVLDITNPERDPVLLWSYSSSDMGLSTSYPAVLRMNLNTDGKTSSTNEKWFAVIGSGVTGYDGRSTQIGQVFAIDLKAGHKDPTNGTSLVRKFSTADNSTLCGSVAPGPCSAIGDIISLDSNLDFRADTLYFGNTISNGSNTPAWYGKMYRLTTGGCSSIPCSSSTWGSIPAKPTVLVATFPSGGTTKVGPITAAPTVSADDTAKIWVFFGTGRHYGSSDKANADTQYLIGVKDPVMSGGCAQTSVTSCEKSNLLDVSNAVVCLACASGTDQVTGVSGVATFDELVAKIQGTGQTAAMDGWYTTLPAARERALSSPTVLGGAVFFTTFSPNGDICTASGDGYVYALYYKTGSAYKESVIGTYASGSSTNVLKSMSLGTGLPSQMAVQIGAQGSGASGSTSSSGCAGSVTGFIQASTGTLNQFCGKPALSVWSRYLSWVNQRS